MIQRIMERYQRLMQKDKLLVLPYTGSRIVLKIKNAKSEYTHYRGNNNNSIKD